MPPLLACSALELCLVSYLLFELCYLLLVGAFRSAARAGGAERAYDLSPPRWHDRADLALPPSSAASLDALGPYDLRAASCFPEYPRWSISGFKAHPRMRLESGIPDDALAFDIIDATELFQVADLLVGQHLCSHLSSFLEIFHSFFSCAENGVHSKAPSSCDVCALRGENGAFCKAGVAGSVGVGLWWLAYQRENMALRRSSDGEARKGVADREKGQKNDYITHAQEGYLHHAGSSAGHHVDPERSSARGLCYAGIRCGSIRWRINGSRRNCSEGAGCP